MNHLKTDRDCACEKGFATPTLEEKVAFLSDPRSYSGFAGKVEVRETHMSWVFLAGDYRL